MKGCARRSPGTSKIAPGATASPGRAVASALASEGSSREGDHPGRRRGHAALSSDARDEQAALARLRQADDLLPTLDADACGHPRDPDHLDTHGSAALPGAA